MTDELITAEVREQVARAAYEADPYYEPGEMVEHFQVSPGGWLSWDQAKRRDAEFGEGSGLIPITKAAYACADASLSVFPALIEKAREEEREAIAAYFEAQKVALSGPDFGLATDEQRAEAWRHNARMYGYAKHIRARKVAELQQDDAFELAGERMSRDAARTQPETQEPTP